MVEADLVAAAWAARERAVAPYSHFRVGAALLGRSGRVWTGCNVESVSYGLTCCAERVALFKALSEGETGFDRVVVVADCSPVAMPCGACRQLLAEYAPDATLLAASHAGSVATTVRALLPQPFDPSALP